MTNRYMVVAMTMALVGLVAQSAAAQWSIDLAAVAKQEFQVPPGTDARIVVVNKAPNVPYHIVAVLRPIPVAPLESVSITGEDTRGGCPELVQVAVNLQNATAETKVGQLMLELQQALPGAGCTGTQRGFIRAVMASTVYVLPVEYVIRAGEELVVTVNRLKADNTVEKTWTLILTTGAQGSWRTLYGIALVPDRDDDPFLTPGEKEGEFIVNAGASRDREDFPVRPAPSVFFSWMSRSAEFGPLAVSPTLGVGASSELPGLFGGVSITYRQNLALVVGIPFVPQRHVKAQYINNNVVTSTLTTADLTETKYHADKWFIGGVFRFSSNPFGEAKRPAQERPTQ